MRPQKVKIVEVQLECRLKLKSNLVCKEQRGNTLRQNKGLAWEPLRKVTDGRIGSMEPETVKDNVLYYFFFRS